MKESRHEVCNLLQLVKIGISSVIQSSVFANYVVDKDKASIDIMILRMQFPGQPMDHVIRSLELLVKEVIPRVEKNA